MAKHSILVLSNPVEGREEEFNRWYTDTHLPEVLAEPEFVAAQRFRIADVQVGGGPTPPHRYLAVYEVETDDLAALGERLAATQSERPLSDALDQEGMDGWTFTAITERMEAGQASRR